MAHRGIPPRLLRRALLILVNALNSVLVPLLSPLISLAVVRLAGSGVWGEFVGALILVQLGAHVIAWGNKEYLLRLFSFNPARIAHAWQSSLVTRLPLLAILAAIFALAGSSSQRWVMLTLWSLGLVVYQSFDVVVLYKRDFVFATVVELAGLGLALAAILRLGAHVDLDGLIVLFGVTSWLKVTMMAARFRHPFLSDAFGRLRVRERFDARFFREAFPFFVLGLSGLLQSRIDLYTANYFLPPGEVAQYQVLATFVLLLQSLSNFVLAPFAKNIYRIQMQSILGLSSRLLALGAMAALPGLLVTQAIVGVHYGFDLPPGAFVMGGIAALPVFFYLPIVYALYKVGAQSVVVKINLIGIGVSFVLSAALLPRAGLTGAAAAAAAGQCCMGIVYSMQGRSLRADHAIAMPDLS